MILRVDTVLITLLCLFCVSWLWCWCRGYRRVKQNVEEVTDLLPNESLKKGKKLGTIRHYPDEENLLT